MLVEGGGTRKAIEARLAQIRVELERATQDADLEVLRERPAKLASSLAVIHVGAATEPELREKLRRCEGAWPRPGRRSPRGSWPAGAMPDGHGLDALTGEFGDLFAAGSSIRSG